MALTRAQAARILALGAALWLAAYAAARGLDGSGMLAAMAAFFSKAALLSFGGAYAVLPYVHQVAVEQFQWVTAARMIDGLALRELILRPLVLIGSSSLSSAATRPRCWARSAQRPPGPRPCW